MRICLKTMHLPIHSPYSYFKIAILEQFALIEWVGSLSISVLCGRFHNLQRPTKLLLTFLISGNHGEDVKECYYYLDSVPTHSYMKALYKYPQNEYPYSWIVEENRRRSVYDPEFELTDTGIQNLLLHNVLLRLWVILILDPGVL